MAPSFDYESTSVIPLKNGIQTETQSEGTGR